MPKRSNDFQKLVALINGCIRQGAQVTESALLADKITGEKREVDILISKPVADYPINIAVEVIDWKRKAYTPWVEAMHSKHEHLLTNKLVLVSRSGFSKPALTKAEFLNIDTITLEEALGTDWQLAVRMTSSGYMTLTTIEYTCAAVCGKTDDKRIFSPVSRKTSVYCRRGTTTIDKIAQSVLFEPQVKKQLCKQLDTTTERNFTFYYTAPSGTYVLEPDGTKLPLLHVTIWIQAKHTHTPISFSAHRYGERDVAIGKSSDDNAPLYFALVRREDGRTEGLLLDKNGIRSLEPERRP